MYSKDFICRPRHSCFPRRPAPILHSVAINSKTGSGPGSATGAAGRPGFARVSCRIAGMLAVLAVPNLLLALNPGQDVSPLSATVVQEEQEPQRKSKPPGNSETALEQYNSLLGSYNSDMDRYRDSVRKAETDEQRQEAHKLYPDINMYRTLFFALAQKHPETKGAHKALTWVSSVGGPEGTHALDLLLTRYSDSPGLWRVIQSAPLSTHPFRTMGHLEKIAGENEKTRTRAFAHFVLAQMQIRQIEVQKRLKEDESAKAGYEEEYGGTYVQDSLNADTERLDRRAIENLEKAVEIGTETRLYRDVSVAEAAERIMFEFRYLRIGREAEDIVGEDIFGEEFKLSDYRGKVVVLDFWADW